MDSVLALMDPAISRTRRICEKPATATSTISAMAGNITIGCGPTWVISVRIASGRKMAMAQATSRRNRKNRLRIMVVTLNVRAGGGDRPGVMGETVLEGAWQLQQVDRVAGGRREVAHGLGRADRHREFADSATISQVSKPVAEMAGQEEAEQWGLEFHGVGLDEVGANVSGDPEGPATGVRRNAGSGDEGRDLCRCRYRARATPTSAARLTASLRAPSSTMELTPSVDIQKRKFSSNDSEC